MSQVEILSAKDFEGESDTNEDRYKDIILKSIYASNDIFNIDDFEVFEEDFVEGKARETVESYAEEWWEDLRHNNRNEGMMGFVEFDMCEYIDWCINIDGVEHCCGLCECDIVYYEGEYYFVIPKTDIPW